MNNELIQKFAVWLNEAVDWIAHVVAEDFECVCFIDRDLGNDYCAKWRQAQDDKFRAEHNGMSERTYLRKQEELYEAYRQAEVLAEADKIRAARDELQHVADMITNAKDWTSLNRAAAQLHEERIKADPLYPEA